MEELMTLDESVVFNLEVLHRCDFVRVKGESWDAPKNGLVVRVQKDLLTVLFLSASTAVNYLKISAAEVSGGHWEITTSPDLENIYGANQDETP